MGEAAPRKLQAVPALPAAQIENPVIGNKSRRGDQKIDIVGGIDIVLDDIAIRLEIKRVEQIAPPIDR
jgi:hypothetical protein